ncbi:hypothetical protein BU14_1880s0001 [Porphyra umbilicalis]|uniref:Uncharacterized protein n=1 Tax=Porphyra umbilicalis TaxID=2786 RepID=A0A1X6NKU0_PORUM|nr:hypothetical protein BU14_1880s0001 [Porphyra umbilicalis]|eukprot:OSX69086.1 hypothetical protein BU14_1880s0001 [Porphyra umbilicalis]
MGGACAGRARGGVRVCWRWGRVGRPAPSDVCPDGACARRAAAGWRTGHDGCARLVGCLGVAANVRSSVGVVCVPWRLSCAAAWYPAVALPATHADPGGRPLCTLRRTAGRTERARDPHRAPVAAGAATAAAARAVVPLGVACGGTGGIHALPPGRAPRARRRPLCRRWRHTGGRRRGASGSVVDMTRGRDRPPCAPSVGVALGSWKKPTQPV